MNDNNGRVGQWTSWANRAHTFVDPSCMHFYPLGEHDLQGEKKVHGVKIGKAHTHGRDG